MAVNRLTWVDNAKGIGIVLVVYGHVARGMQHSGILKYSPLFQFLDAAVYSFHMPLFFFLSGMFFPGSYKKYGLGLFANKIATIVYPYFVWSCIQLGIKIALAGYTNSPADYGVLLNVFRLPVEQFWFLYSLFLITSVHILFFGLTARTGFTEKFKGMVIFAAALFLYFARPFFPGIFQIQTVASYMPYFSLGLCFSIFSRSHPAKRPVMALPFCFLLLCYTVLLQGYWDADSPFLQLALAVTGTGSIITLSSLARGYAARVLSLFGRYSMEIFCVHIIAASGVRIVLQHLFHINSPVLHLCCGISAGLLLPVLFICLLKKWLPVDCFFTLNCLLPSSEQVKTLKD